MRPIFCDSQTVAYGTSSISINEKPVRNADSQAPPSLYWIGSSRVSSSIMRVVGFLFFCFVFFFWEVYTLEIFKSFQFSSVAQLCLTLCETMDCSMPGFPVQLPELAQTYVHQVGDAIQPSHPLLSPSPHAFNLCQHQVFFQWVCSSHQMAKILEFQLQHQSFQWIFSTDFL